MSVSRLNVSNYPAILENMGVRWGVRSKNRPDLFSFNATLARSYSGVRVRPVLEAGMEAFWIRDSSIETSEAIHLVTCDRSFMDWTRKTGFGSVLFVRGMIYDSSYGTSPCHPHTFMSRISREPLNNIVYLDDFMAQASSELQDFVVKNILFNLE